MSTVLTDNRKYLEPNLKMAGASVATVFLVLTSMIRSSHGQTNAVNVAVNKPISALITCGTPPENYYAQSEGLKQVTQRVESLCDASNSSFAHPPELMVDLNDPTSGEVFTWWQSTSRNMLSQAGLYNPDTIITLNLLESYLVDYVSIQMGDSVRPESMTLMRSSDGIAYSVWEYKVTANSDCLSDYNVDLKSIVESATTVLCSTYGRSMQQQYETIQFTMPVPLELIEWRRAQYIRFEFHNMPRTFGLLSDIFHHYTVRNIVVTAQCECNGHANDCTLQPSEEDPEKETYQCVCGGNTGGISCDQCLPFFNQLPYQPGHTNFACLECNCFQHSEVCYYDSVIGAVNGSLSGVGRYHGGGVCQNCMNNTAGINCERCVEYNYRPLTSVQSAEDACQPCDCYLDGTREDPSIGLNKGHCVMNNDTVLPIGMVPGDCYCKDNVIGSKCDACRNGYFHLTDNNPDGCTNCNCFTAGTDNGTAVCSKDPSGQCPCKTFVVGRRCDTCQDEFYALSADNLEGCLPCECNVGGAISNLCDKGSGQCICKNYVSSRQCDRPLLMSYYPTVHFINAEFETTRSPYWERDDTTNPGYSYFGYLAITGALTVSTTITVPTTQLSGRTEIVLRYAIQSSTVVSVSISPGELTSGSTQMGQATLLNCPSGWCYDPVYNMDQSRGLYFEVEPGDWTVNVLVNMEEAKLYLDQVILIPEEFLNPVGVLEPITAQQFVTTCDVQDNDMRIGTETEDFCLSSVFIITTTYLDGNLQCNCDLAGSVSNNCNPYGGQCPCQPGVGGRRCDVCLPEFYDFRSTGCKACNCYSDEKVCDSLTGQCDCPTNTVGRQCDRCITYAWGLNSTTGCKMCNCNSVGSVSLQCNFLYGTCFCHPGVGGEKCTECLEGFRTLTSAGCTSCQCDVAGSYNGTCNVTTGQCHCKENTEGVLCDTCSSSSFYISEMYETGCLDCVCMGVTSECSSSLWKNSLFQIGTSNDALWSVAANRFATELYADPPVPILIGGVSYMSISVPAGSDLYWWPLDGPFLDGNLLSLYGNDVRFVLYYEAPASIASPVTEPKALLSGLGNRYTYTFNPVLNATFTPVSITMEETYWRIETTDEQISRQDFMKTLSRVDFFLISATLFFDDHLSSIGEFYYDQATAPGSEFYDPRAATSLAVEDCTCGPGYSGLSCEECAADYYRTNVTEHPYFGVCIPCTCNGHSDSCDPSNGQCLDCQHNTTGINCEICANGTYGDATAGTENDCTDCPCGPPKAYDARCDVIEGVVTCLSCLPGHVGPLCDSCETFYFGEPELEDGFCEECNCSGNALECNTRTGQCIDCQSRTTGFNCERCENSTYGDASLQMCQDCNCHVLGSLNFVCNHRSGQCPCKYGVGTLTCAQCMDNFYGFGLNEGCIACECNELGSTSLQCNEQGLCNCFGGAVGDKCDICSQGYYGLPTQSCQSCSCDPVGTIGGSAAICDIITGQCPCQPGIGERTCSRCMPTWINFGITGCEKCDQCVDTLYDSLLNLNDLWLELWSVAVLLGELQERDMELQPLSVVVNDTAYMLAETIRAYDQLQVDIMNIDQDQYRTDVNTLYARAENNLATALALEEIVFVKLGELEALKTDSDQLYTDSMSADQLLDNNYVALLALWNETSYSNYATALGQSALISTMSFTDEQVEVVMELELSQNTSVQAANFYAQSTSQGQRVNSLQASIRSTESTLLEVQTTVDATHDILDIVDVTLARVDVVLNATQYQISYSDSVVEGIISTLAVVDASILAALESNTAGDGDFVAAMIIKDGASTGYTGIPIDQSINQYSINGWSSAMVASRFRLNDLQDLQPNTELTVVLAENTALSLANTAQDTVTIFSVAQASGQQPVDVVDNYEGVVSTISEAEAVIQNANDTIAATTSFLDTISVDTLMSQANSSKILSRLILDVVELRTTDPEALNDTLTVAYNGISNSEALWDSIEADTDSLGGSANSLALLAADPMIQPAINMGISDSAAARTTSNNVITNSAALDERVLTNAAEITVVQDSITNSTMLLNQIPVVVGQIETDISDLTVMVNQLEILRNETAAQRFVVTDRLALLQQKLLLAQEAVANSKQPVRFAPDSSISVARTPTVQTLFNELNMDLKTDLRDGLAFFVENPDTGDLFSIEVVTSHVLFKYNLGQDLVTVESPIDVCCGEWYHVIATRYGHEGQLSVEKLSTGGASTDVGSSVITYDMYMNLGSTSLYYVGGIPSEYELLQTLDFTGTIEDIMANQVDATVLQQTDKVQSRDFEGCIANVVFDGQELDLWRPVSLAGSTSCCPRPDLPDLGTDTLIDGLSFTGFGYFQLINSQEDFNIYQQARISIEFRTSVSDGVVFLVTRQDLISYIGIFMEANKIVFEMNTAGNVKYRLASNRDFNNAEWVQVTTAFNASYYSMQIRAANISQTLLFHQESRTYAPLSFANLRVSSKVMIGSPDPDLNAFIVRGPTNLKFAGCVRNLQLSYASSMILVPRPLNNETVADFQDVSFDGCLGQVVPGVGFSGDYAYARLSLPAELAQVQRIYIQFKTLEPDAILAYSWDAESFNKLFYIALYHGNVFVQYNIGEGLTEPLQTKGLRLNNGQWQTVTVEFTGLSATLRVNSMPLILSNRQLSTDGILITGSNSYLYIGGVPSTIPNLIGGEFPVRESLNGDIRNFMINDVTPNFNDDAILTEQQGITLSGVTPPVATLPPLPYVTEPPPTSITPMPMCSDLPGVFLYPDVFRFGLEDNSYAIFPLTEDQQQYFLFSFVITIEFRAVSPNGILYYAANNALLPREWIALVIINGYLEFSMISDARSVTGIGIRTKQKYDNGEWIKVTVLRINEFVAILVTETRDYANNAQASDRVTSRINIGTDFNLGGISPSILLSTFPLTFTTGFDGCIRNVEIQTDDIPQDLILDFKDPSLYSAQSVETCSLNDIIPGAFFNGTGYLQLANNFVVGDSLSLSMTIRTTVRETILFAVSSNVENFVALDIFEGGVRAIVSHSSSSPYIVRSSVFVNGYEICDNLPHTVELHFSQLGLQLTVDSYPPDITYFSPGVPTIVTNSPIYFGGIPETGAVQLISGIMTNSFTGCIQTILLNDVQRNPRDNVDSVGMTTGCPFPLT